MIMELNRFKQLLESTMGDVKPLILEQNNYNILTQKGYKEDPNYITNLRGKFKSNIESTIDTLKTNRGFNETKIYVKGETVLISDGLKVYFIVSPQNMSYFRQKLINDGISVDSDLGPYSITDIQDIL